MSEVSSQDIAQEKCNAYATFGIEKKRRIEEAGQALMRGDTGASDLLVAAASPLCVIVTGQMANKYKRLKDRRGEFRAQAKVGLSEAVASLDRRFRDGSLQQLTSTFRAYLSQCIRSHLIRYSKKSAKAEREELMQNFDLEKDSGFDHVEIKLLKPVEKQVFEMRMRGKKWKEIANSISKTTRTAQRLFKKLKHQLKNPFADSVAG